MIKKEPELLKLLRNPALAWHQKQAAFLETDYYKKIVAEKKAKLTHQEFGLCCEICEMNYGVKPRVRINSLWNAEVNLLCDYCVREKRVLADRKA